ncbi:enoyl-CoA hydratase/isomerase family protein [Maritalea porphyrae]|uniref:2-(1,2-epoxy-1,2-dihydrophenyl)acetyl-CoA isomerase n=1 Tax=Maritalea porphyrae TaxID=880732 RepID=A0ABQ5UTQ6_9HYPH|nr:enoyl-CoA hydratase/isomerase family protein [Maritalea porphyrae]GLQ17347.1 2-(1,2-epoxy-1,2-dihydrophenyl)acetyl-CoA isomerase [Maritalea porphyrae]
MTTRLVTSCPIDNLSNQLTGRRITLNNPKRSNALVPELTRELLVELETVKDRGEKIVIIDAEGAHFSTGGDIGRFAEQIDQKNGQSFAHTLVEQLQLIVFKLLAMDAIIVTAAQGAITGGSAGIVFASDLVVFDETSFIQPYYREVGFAPDGGWSALLPEIIGAKRAATIQLANKRIEPKVAVEWGIGQHLTSVGKAQEKAHSIAMELSRLPNFDALTIAKRLVWNEEKLETIERGLEAETGAFLNLFRAPHIPSTLAAFSTGRAS